MGKFARLTFALCVLVMCTSGAFAQTGGSGALSGFVTDQTGAFVPGAVVTLTNTTTGQLRSTETTNNGSYSFLLLLPGPYGVRITKTGFKAFEAPSVQIHVTETAQLDAKLEVGAAQESVTVSASEEQLQTQSSAVGTLVDSRVLVGAALSTRNYTQIISMSTGVIAGVSDAGQLGPGSPQLFVNGNINSANNFQMDGANANSFGSGTVEGAGNFYESIPLPNPDALQEFKVQTALYDASTGRNPGANVEVITKSGTNSLHGVAFEFLRNTALDANDFFRNRNGLPRATMQQNQFGGSFGGPIMKDKFFFFGSYQGTRQSNGLSRFSSSSPFLPPQLFGFNRNLSAASPAPGVPSPLAAALGAAFCHVTPASASAGPGTGFFGGTAIKCDGSNINPVALNIMNAKLPNGAYYLPNPQTATGASSFSIPAKYIEDQFLVNLDYIVSPKHTVSERYFYSRNPQVRTFDCNSPCAPGSIGLVSGENHNFVVKLTSVLTSNLVNEAKAAYTYNHFLTRTDIQPGITAEALGFKNLTTWFGAMPTISVSGLFNLNGPTSTGGESAPATYILGDQISWNHGRHSIRAGFEWDHIRYTFYVTDVAKGTLTFQSFNDLLLGLSAAQNGTSFSNVFSSSGTTSPVGGLHYNYRITDMSSFVQDDIKITPRFTANVGVRWEYFGGMSDTNGFVPNFSLAALNTAPIPPVAGTLIGFDVASNYPGTPPAGVVRRSTPYGQEHSMPLGNFGPRVGFAWQPLSSNRLVVRAGFGLVYQRVNGNFLFGPNNTLPPLVATAGGSGATNAQSTWAVPFTNINAPGFVPRTPTTALRASFLSDPWKTPYTMTYSTNVQYSLRPNLSLEVDYVGHRAAHLMVSQALNVPKLASVANPITNPQTGALITTNTAANVPLRVPYVGFAAVGGLATSGGFGDSNYNSLQATLRKRFSHGLQFQGSYTWAKVLTDELGGNGVGGGNFNSNNPLDHRQLYAPADYDRTHRFVASYAYEFPRFHNSKGVAGKVLAGWSISGLTTMQTGDPLTFTDSRGGTAFGSASRAQFCPGMTNANVATSGSVEERLNAYANIAAFCAPPIVGIGGPGTTGTDFGNTSRGILRGPGQNSTDLALAKTTIVGGVREDAHLDFRAEFFNAFNHPQFADPTVVVSTPASFGKINATSVAARLIQFSLKYSF
jgi:hypothetical protein